MLVGVHQPQYIPWLGYFNKILRSDVFVYLDNVQYKHREWQNRNRILSTQGPIWLTVPVSFNRGQNINEVKINYETDWPRKHTMSLEKIYSKAPFFKELFPRIEEFYNKKYDNLSELCITNINLFNDILGIKTKIMLSSEIDACEGKTDRLVDICVKLSADAYLSGAGGKGYMEMEKFDLAGLDVVYQEFKHPEYPQKIKPKDSEDFVPYMSILDLIFNCGRESLGYIEKGWTV